MIYFFRPSRAMEQLRPPPILPRVDHVAGSPSLSCPLLVSDIDRAVQQLCKFPSGSHGRLHAGLLSILAANSLLEVPYPQPSPSNRFIFLPPPPAPQHFCAPSPPRKSLNVLSIGDSDRLRTFLFLVRGPAARDCLCVTNYLTVSTPFLTPSFSFFHLPSQSLTSRSGVLYASFLVLPLCFVSFLFLLRVLKHYPVRAALQEQACPVFPLLTFFPPPPSPFSVSHKAHFWAF